MSRPQTYADILLNLPVDDTLKTFIERHTMPLPEGWIWHDSVQASKSLVGLIQMHPNAAMRDRIVAGLHASTLLAHPLGKQAMFQAAHDRPTELMGLIACKSDLHRAFWLYVNHPALFEAAAEIEYLDHEPGGWRALRSYIRFWWRALRRVWRERPAHVRGNWGKASNTGDASITRTTRLVRATTPAQSAAPIRRSAVTALPTLRWSAACAAWCTASPAAPSRRPCLSASAKVFWKYLKSASISGCSGLGIGGSKPGSSINSQPANSMPQAFDRPA